MRGFEKASKILEFNKILTLLSDCAPTEGAAERILQLTPKVELYEVNRLLDETTDAKRLTVTKGNAPFGRVRDITSAVDRAEKGAVLITRELLDIALMLRVVVSVKRYKGQNDAADTLDDYFANLVPNSFLEGEISRCIVTEDQISDDASDSLYTIRRNIRRSEANIRDQLAKFTSGHQSKYLQDNIVTVRNGRYVIPVKAEYRNEIKGLIHDTSSSGATLFIEPLAVLEVNNALREYKAAEAEEIERILYDLSANVAKFSALLLQSYNALTELAIIFAKAELSYRLIAERPTVLQKEGSNIGYHLIKARHPLLPQSTVVPVTIEMAQDIKTLVITGPNTGGKTVTLKTIGLFSLMAQAGLHLPCSDQTKLPLFESVLPDIGDEQSIEQSLSTFSGHITNIVDILNKATDRSLVLFDELGAGTDPGEGAALAIAILEKVRSIGAFCAATTHYSELKLYASESPAVLNASCEFDIITLRPTYRLLTGIPGKSNAFAIAGRLGIADDILNYARSVVNDENLRFETVVSKLEESEFLLRKEREEAAQSRQKAEKILQEAHNEKQLVESLVEKELEKAKAQARKLILGAKALSDDVFKNLDELKRQKDKEDYAAHLEQTRKSIASNIKSMSSKVDLVDNEPNDYELPRPLREGDHVSILGMGGSGVVTMVDGNKVSVKIGNSTIKLSSKKLKLHEAKQNSKKARTSTRSPARNFDLKREINLLGQTVEEAWLEVDSFIDSAIYEGFEQITLIHGKGTGSLRNGLWQYLKNDNRIKSYRLGTYGEGDLGVTVVEIK